MQIHSDFYFERETICEGLFWILSLTTDPSHSIWAPSVINYHFSYYRPGDSPSGQGGGYQVHSNGHSEGVSPNSSQLSMEGREGTLVTRTQKQHVSHNVSERGESFMYISIRNYSFSDLVNIVTYYR